MRVVGLPAGSMELAQAVAILGPGGEPRLASALAGIDAATASRALDALAAAELLNPEQALSFVHPLVAQAITGDIPVHTRAHLHRQAAVWLGAEHADPERIAAHLLAATCAGDSWAVEALRSAARRAMAHGGAESAVRYLERALDEPPTAPTRAELLVELGEAEAAAGRPTAPERLKQALALIEDPARRAEVWRIRGSALFMQGRHAEAARAFDAGAEELERFGDNARAREFHAAYVAAATIDPTLRTEALSRANRLLVDLPNDLAAADRVILAQAALHHALAGGPRDFVRDLALRAWDGGALLNDETASGFNWTLISGALYFTDELELALEVCEAAMADARALASPLAFATASYERSLPLFQLGRISAAAADAQAAVDAARYGWSMYSRSALYIQAMCQLERDELDAAADTLAILEHESPDSSIEHPALLDAHAILLRRRGFARESLAEHLEVGRLFGEVFGVHTTGDIAWRLGAAEAALDAGDRDLGATLADEELAFARKVGLTRGIIGALRVRALAETGERRLSLLQEAVAQPEPAPARLEHLRALVDLGAALRRANRRAVPRAAARGVADGCQPGRELAGRPCAPRAERGRGPAPANDAQRRGGADPQRAQGRGAGGDGRDQQGDRQGTVRDRQDRRVPPASRVPEARRELPTGPERRTRRSVRRPGGRTSAAQLRFVEPVESQGREACGYEVLRSTLSGLALGPSSCEAPDDDARGDQFDQ